MPAQSQQQQKLFGLALAFKRGEVPSSEVSDEIKAIADRMSEKEIEDFASTKHKGLPKMKEQLRKIVREIMREKAISEMNEQSVNEGKKVFRVNPQIGKAKYSISSHDGVKKHKDGSDFFDIETFKNKVDLEKAIKNYTSKGFKMESVNEVDTKKANLLRNNMPGYVGPKFAKKASDEDLLAMADLKDEKAQLYNKYLKDVMSKISKLQKKYNIKESVNEGYSTEEKRIVMMAVRKLAKYRSVPIDQSINDLLGAGQELERDIKKGKIKK